MLLEVCQYLTTPCPAHFRRLGYLKELIATEARERRCRTVWKPHLDRSKAVITKAAEASAGKEKVVVIGAGMLADIPLDMLANKFKRVELVDVCFTMKPRWYAWRHPHIELKTCDVTGVTTVLAKGDLPVPGMPKDVAFADADLVVSVNVLSQLPLVPLRVLAKSHPHLDDGAIHAFAQGIIRHHLAMLEACRGTVCLVTEVERQFRDGDQLIETEDPLWGLVPDRMGDEWIWDIAPRPDASPKYDIRNRVKGMIWQGEP